MVAEEDAVDSHESGSLVLIPRELVVVVHCQRILIPLVLVHRAQECHGKLGRLRKGQHSHDEERKKKHLEGRDPSEEHG